VSPAKAGFDLFGGQINPRIRYASPGATIIPLLRGLRSVRLLKKEVICLLLLDR
jgi:hypothetical protein